jgi:hypothetical protein
VIKYILELTDEEWALLFDIFDHFISAYPGPLSREADKLLEKIVMTTEQ